MLLPHNHPQAAPPALCQPYAHSQISRETIAEPALEFPAHKFQPVGLGAPEPLHGQNQTLLGVVRNSQHTPRHVESFRPKMQQRLFGVSTDFPGQIARERPPAAILMQINEAGRRGILRLASSSAAKSTGLL